MKKLLVCLCLSMGLFGCSSKGNSSNEKTTQESLEFKDLGSIDITGLFQETEDHEMEYLSTSDGYMYFQDADTQNFITTAIYQLDVDSGEIEQVPYNLPEGAYISNYVVNFGKEFVTYSYANADGTIMETMTIDGEVVIDTDGMIILTDHGESLVVGDGNPIEGVEISWYNNEFDLIGTTTSGSIGNVFSTGTYWGYSDEEGMYYTDGEEIQYYQDEDNGGYYNVMDHYIILDVDDNGETSETQLIDMDSGEVTTSTNISYGTTPGAKYQYYLVDENQVGVEYIQDGNVVSCTLDGVQIDGIYDQIGYLSDTEILLTQYTTTGAFTLGELIVNE